MITIKSVGNGFIVTVYDTDGTTQTTTIFEIGTGDHHDLEVYQALAYHILETLGYPDSKHQPRRLWVRIEG